MDVIVIPILFSSYQILFQELAQKIENEELNLLRLVFIKMRHFFFKIHYFCTFENEKSGFNLGTCLVNSGEPRAGVEQLLKILSLLPDNDEHADKVNTQTLYYNLGIGLAYVGEWSTCFSVLGTNFSCYDVITGKIANDDVSTLIIHTRQITFSNSSPRFRVIMFFLSRKPSSENIISKNTSHLDHEVLPKMRNSKSENIVNPSLYAKAAMTRGKAAERMRMFDVALDELRKARETAERIGDWSTASKGMTHII